jgi:hypothetical protein
LAELPIKKGVGFAHSLFLGSLCQSLYRHNLKIYSSLNAIRFSGFKSFLLKT